MAITGKQRSRRIDRNYTSVLDPSILWKRRLGWLGLAFGLAYGMWIFLSPSAAKQLSTGELSKAHHAWNETGCEKCHAPLSPIKTTSVGRTPQAIAENNDRCNSCHRMSDHFPNSMKPEKLELESCVQCHHEHLGFNHNLRDVADESCVKCHKDLTLYVKDSVKASSRSLPSVVSFDPQPDGSGHPGFRGLEKDTGTVSFSHVQHMRLGQPRTPGDATAKKFDSLAQRYKEQYQARVDKGLVQLTCGDCHQRDHAVSGYDEMELYSELDTALALQSNEHVLYQPIDFSKHCEACHQLAVPHKLDFKDTNYLADVVEADQLQRLSESARKQNADPNSSEKSLDTFRQSSTGKDLVKLLKSKAPEAKSTLYTTYGCNKCHQLSEGANQAFMADQIVVSSGIKSQWLKDASFTHGAHVNVQCKKCHDMDLASPATPDAPNPPLGGHASQVLIGGIDTCRDCHKVDEGKRLEAQGHGNRNVATADCIDCHRYHHEPVQASTPNASKPLVLTPPMKSTLGAQGNSP